MSVYFLLMIREEKKQYRRDIFTVKVYSLHVMNQVSFNQTVSQLKHFSKTGLYSGVRPLCSAWPLFIRFCNYGDAAVCTGVAVATCPSSESVVVSADERARWLRDLYKPLTQILKSKLAPQY